jgi:hypothetical protein
MISDYMCGPLQDFAYIECGCGIHNPACASDPSKCFGGANYEAPYRIPFLDDNDISTTQSFSLAGSPGGRRLRGGAHEDQGAKTKDLKFKSRKPEQHNDVSSSSTAPLAAES